MNQPINVNVDITRTKALACQRKVGLIGDAVCGSEEFTQVFFVRVLPAFLSPTMREEIIPLPAFKCVKCGMIAELSQKKEK